MPCWKVIPQIEMGRRLENVEKNQGVFQLSILNDAVMGIGRAAFFASFGSWPLDGSPCSFFPLAGAFKVFQVCLVLSSLVKWDPDTS